MFWIYRVTCDRDVMTLTVKMYRCSHGKGDSCGKCLLMDSDLLCGWCERKKECMLCDDCTGGTCDSIDGGVYPGWLDKAQICMHPEITKVSRLLLPLDYLVK